MAIGPDLESVPGSRRGLVRGRPGCAEPQPKGPSGVATQPAGAQEQAIARREAELAAQLHDGVIRSSPDCGKLAAFIRRFHGDVKGELARLDRERQPSDYDYLLAKRIAWKKIVATKSRRYFQVHAACYRDAAYSAADELVRSLDRRSCCKEPEPPPKRQPRPAPNGRVVPQTVLEARRLRGEPGILPDPPDVQAMAIEETGTVAVVKMCLDERGHVRDATILKTSCFPRYDAKLLAQIKTWQYSPLIADGEPAPVCTSLTFIYRPD